MPKQNTNIANVWLWGKRIGAVSMVEGQSYAQFAYDPAFIHSGIEISPIKMPLKGSVYTFPELDFKTFHGLPGLLADSLPDKFGNVVLSAWLSANKRSIESLNSIERLCYLGKRGMGALEFVPAYGSHSDLNEQIQIDELVRLANRVLSMRESVQGNFATETLKEKSLRGILQVGSSAGGARAKAVIAWNPVTNEIRSGQIETPAGFENWLIKFDGISNNGDKESYDPVGYGLIEYAYYKMVIDCGITMNQCDLLKENGRNHFMTLRFDRTTNGEKIHMQSLCGIAHYDFNKAGQYSYEQAFEILDKMGIAAKWNVELFRRMVFNIIARNQDDHVKNIAFLMDKKGIWSLAPAYDMTYNYNKGGDWTGIHQMTVNGKRDNFTTDDLIACGQSAGIQKIKAKRVINHVLQVVSSWRDYADDVGVSATKRDEIYNNLRLDW